MQSIFYRIHYFLLIAFVSSLPFSFGDIKLNSYLIVLLGMNAIPTYFLFERNLRNSFNPILVLFVSCYFIYVVGLIGSDNFHEGIFELQKKLSIFLFPVIFFMSPKLKWIEVKNVLVAYIVGCLTAALVCWVTAMYQFLNFNDSSYLFYHGLSSIVGMHSTYLAMYYCLAIVIILFISIKQVAPHATVWYMSGGIILLISVLLLGARTQIVAMIFIAVLFFFHFSYSRFGWVKSLLGTSGVLILMVCLVLLIPTNRERFKEAVNYKGEYAQNKKWGDQQVRYLIWSSAFEVIRSNLLFGVGTGDVQDELQSYYLSKEYRTLTYLDNTRYNAHNQFLESAIGLGLIGLCVLVCILFTSLKYAFSTNNWLYFIFISLFIVSCMTESLLERQGGIVFYAFFNSLLFFNNIGATNRASDHVLKMK